MNKATKAAKWVAWNAALCWLAWEGVQGNVGAGRLLVFLVAASAFLIVVCAFSDEGKEKVKAEGRSVPAWVAFPVGLTQMCFMAWHGWAGTALAFLVMEMAEAYIHEGKNK